MRTCGFSVAGSGKDNQLEVMGVLSLIVVDASGHAHGVFSFVMAGLSNVVLRRFGARDEGARFRNPTSLDLCRGEARLVLI